MQSRQRLGRLGDQPSPKVLRPKEVSDFHRFQTGIQPTGQHAIDARSFGDAVGVLQVVSVEHVCKVKVETDSFDRRRCASLGGKEREELAWEVLEYGVPWDGGAQLQRAQRSKIGEADVVMERLVYSPSPSHWRVEYV